MGTQADFAARSPRERVAALLSKQGLVVTAIAGDLLGRARGDRVERVQEYARRLDASVGTVQSALEFLQGAGAVRLAARGRLGSFVAEISYPLLWSLALSRPLVGAMPLPYSRRFAGLATGIRAQLSGQPIDLDLRYMRGATQRMEALASGACDWAVVSRFAAETAHAHGFALEVALALGPESYMADPVLLLRSAGQRSLQPGMRVGVDLQSPDHVYNTRHASRGVAVEQVAIEYAQGLELLRAGAIDATVWSREDIPAELSGMAAVPLSSGAATAALGEAAIVVGAGSRAIRSVLAAVLDPADLVATQRAVVAYQRRPDH